jgi:hypothetical protein
MVADMREEMDAHPRARLTAATDVAAVAVAKQIEPDVVNGKIQAHIITAPRNS